MDHCAEVTGIYPRSGLSPLGCLSNVENSGILFIDWILLLTIFTHVCEQTQTTRCQLSSFFSSKANVLLTTQPASKSSSKIKRMKSNGSGWIATATLSFSPSCTTRLTATSTRMEFVSKEELFSRRTRSVAQPKKELSLSSWLLTSPLTSLTASTCFRLENTPALTVFVVNRSVGSSRAWLLIRLLNFENGHF